MFSELQQRGRATVERLRHSRALLVERRDGENLVLTTAERADQAREAASAVARLFVAICRRAPNAGITLEIADEVFPWTGFLHRDQARQFISELVSTVHAADAIDNPVPITQVISRWRCVAERIAEADLPPL